MKRMQAIRRYFAIKDVRLEQEEPTLGQLYKRNLSIAWPAALEGALMSIISSVDTMMVGTLGYTAIAAVGLTTQPRMILLILAQALCVGTTAIVSRRKGEQNRESANMCFGQSMLVVTFLGILMALIGYFGAEPFMRFAGANEDTLDMAVSYFRIISLAMPFNCWSLCICAAMRAIGSTRVTLATNLAANLVNVVFNYLLIGGNFGFPRLGVCGAALATAIGTVVGCVIAFCVALKKSGYLRLRLKYVFCLDKPTLHGLATVGSSSIAESVCLRAGFLITAKLIASLSTDAFATYQIVSQVTMLTFTLGDGIAAASATLVGQSIGAQRRDVAMANVRISRKIAGVVSVIVMLVIFFFRRPFAELFTQEATIISDASLAFLVVMCAIIPQNGRVVYSGCLRGAGDVRFVALCSLLSVTILRPILTWLLCYPLNSAIPAAHFAVTGPWIAFGIDAVIRDRLLIARVKKGQWLNIRL